MWGMGNGGHGDRVSIGGDENAPELTSGDGCNFVTILKATEKGNLIINVLYFSKNIRHFNILFHSLVISALECMWVCLYFYCHFTEGKIEGLGGEVIQRVVVGIICK